MSQASKKTPERSGVRKLPLYHLLSKRCKYPDADHKLTEIQVLDSTDRVKQHSDMANGCHKIFSLKENMIFYLLNYL